MAPRERVKVDLEPLRRFKSVIGRDLRQRGNGPVRAALRQWAARFRGYLRRRFVANSKGSGGWPGLAPATIRRRRRGAGSKRKTRASQAILEQRGGLAAGGVAILRDTGTLFSVLDPAPGKPGQLEEDIPFGIRVGFGGPARHPKGGATIADIAAFHQAGAGHLPQREIVAEPDARTVAGMARDMQAAVDQILRDSEQGGSL